MPMGGIFASGGESHQRGADSRAADFLAVRTYAVPDMPSIGITIRSGQRGLKSSIKVFR